MFLSKRTENQILLQELESECEKDAGSEQYLFN